MRAFGWVAVGLALVSGAAAAGAASVVAVDGFESIEGWSATASEGAQVWIAQEPGHVGQALRIDYDLGNSNGYVIVRKAFSLSLPKNFAFTFDVLGEGLRNNLEFKLVDPSDADHGQGSGVTDDTVMGGMGLDGVGLGHRGEFSAQCVQGDGE